LDPGAGEAIAYSGQARLFKKPYRKHALIGDSAADRAEAEKRISMFMKNDAVHGCSPAILKTPTQLAMQKKTLP